MAICVVYLFNSATFIRIERKLWKKTKMSSNYFTQVSFFLPQKWGAYASECLRSANSQMGQFFANACEHLRIKANVWPKFVWVNTNPTVCPSRYTKYFTANISPTNNETEEVVTGRKRKKNLKKRNNKKIQAWKSDIPQLFARYLQFNKCDLKSTWRTWSKHIHVEEFENIFMGKTKDIHHGILKKFSQAKL